MTRIFCLGGALALSMTIGVQAQQLTPGVDLRTSVQIRKQAQQMLEEARKSPGGVASVTLEKYGNHYTMLTVRTKSGGAEQHAQADDMFFVVEGEATLVSGGKIADAKEVSTGEVRGTKVEGGNSQTMRPGDVIHISPGIPHQTVVAPGKTFVYYVVKVVEAK